MNSNFNHFPVVDLFAGPGGLGEGFSSLKNQDNTPIFTSVAAIERDTFAHQTLHLRHFLKAFPEQRFPAEYYDYLAGNISKQTLYERFPIEKNHADNSALKISLGDEDPSVVNKIILDRLAGAKLWALVGGPPCQAYSLVGRSRMKNDPACFLP